MKIRTRVTSEVSWKLENLRSLESSKIGKVREMNPPGALYRRRNWVGVIPPKIWGEMPAIGSPSHRRTWGTKRCIELLMRRCGLRSARTVAGHAKWHFYMWKSKKHVELIIQGQNPTFLLRGEKIGVLRGYCGVQEFK